MIDEKADAWLEDERTSTLYQVIGALAEAAGVFDDPHVIRALDLAAYGKTQDGGDVLPFCPAYESAKQKGEAEGWRALMKELADDLEAEVENRYPAETLAYPSMRGKYKLDMEPVLRARAMLSAGGEG